MLEMLLHVLLWLFVITTDRISSLSQPDCGGEVSLDQGPVGHVLLPGPSLSSRGSVWSCSWVIEIPEGRTLLLELAQSPGGAGVSVLCGDVTGAHRQVLGGQGGALLKGCGGNQAHITWTGDGRSPDEIQLSYQVQEDERTSWSESDRTGPPSAQTLTHWTQTRTSFTGALPVGSEVMTRTEEVRGHLRGGEDSTQDRGPTSPLTGLWVAGRGTPPFPEEGPNNGAETSGTVHSTERPVSVTHPSFEHTLHTDVFTTETDSGPEHRQNQNQNQVYSSGLQEDPTPSTSNSPPSALYSTRGGATVPPISHDEDVSATPKPSQSHSWRIHRSTKRLGSDPVTSDPSRSPFVAVSRDSDGVHAGSPTPESYTPTPTAAFRSPARPVAPEWTAPNPSPADSGTASQSERGAEIHSRTAATQRTERLGHTPHPVSTFTRPQTTAENTRLPGTDQLTDGTLTGSAPTPGDGPASPAVESTRTETQTLPPSCTLLHEQTHQTSAGPPSLPSIPDSGPWYRQTTHSVMPSSTLSPCPSPPCPIHPVPSTLSQSALSQSTLSQSPLSQSPLSQSTLSQSTLSQSTLSQSPLSQSPLSQSTLSQSTLSQPTLSQSALSQSTLSQSTLSQPTLSQSALSQSTLSQSTLSQSTLSQSALSQSTLSQSTLSQPTLSQSALSQSTLSQSPLPQSTLSPSTLSQSTLSQSTLSDQETVPASPPAPAVSPSQTALLPSTTAGLVLRVSPGLSLADHVPWSSVPGLTTTYSSTAAPSLQPPHRTTEGSGQETKSRPTSSAETSTSAATQRSTTSQTPRFYVVPDHPAVIKVESIELLLQITVEGSAFNSGREEDATAWVRVRVGAAPAENSPHQSVLGLVEGRNSI
ncbi:mucin-5AC-like [Cynoglossus semilaevis]|uniref:mucin-5AC-like n=1 Tax=Cynoglossus semilaevis TaxID=244447 RepID=UPI000D62A5F6|nr:mucin-5AC-like [Cynoglossus semilaevis]